MPPDPPGSVQRLFTEESRQGDDRDNFQRDRDIILYSSALQRLSTTTQVVSGEFSHVFHNRLTHTLQVAQVGRRLAEKLKIKQPELAAMHAVNEDVVESACLAHDLGHPPFGHLAEEVLNRLAGDEAQGFEGNAQSFRIVTELAFRDDKYGGLNLTNRTLRAILKYPWTYRGRPEKKRNKWGSYDSELTSFQLAVGESGTGPFPCSAEAELMDWADDLTYAIHDAEDFYRAGLIPLHLLLPKGTREGGEPDFTAEGQRFLDYVVANKTKLEGIENISDSDIRAIFADLLFAYFKLSGPYEGTREDRTRLRTFTSQLVGRYINGLSLMEPSGDGRVVHIVDDYQRQITLLKQLTRYYVIDSPGLAAQQHANRQIIRYLFNAFLQETKKSPSRLLPPYYRERLQKVGGTPSAVRRVVVDLIAGMTEAQALMTYQRLNGIVHGSALDKLVV
ncbi:MAG: dGTP triphosphohydrolase [Terracidiphilus sp.]